MIGRVWRELALTWFDATNREIGDRLNPDFLRKLWWTIAFGTEEEIEGTRDKHERQSAECWRICMTDSPARIDPDVYNDWMFPARYNAAFAALCALALEDFR